MIKETNAINFKKVLEDHGKWLEGDNSGVRADLSFAFLAGMPIVRANLQLSVLSGANLSDVHFVTVNLNGADLSNADLSNSNLNIATTLSGANLDGAKIDNTIGNKLQIKSCQIDTYNIAYSVNELAIGHVQYLIHEWKNFSDEDIINIGGISINWWNKWKHWIFDLIEMSPAVQ